MNIMNRVGERVSLNGEIFHLQDILSVMPRYDKANAKIHFCDGRKHYVSDGWTQIGCELPYRYMEDLFMRLSEVRMCRQQRLVDEEYFRKIKAK